LDFAVFQFAQCEGNLRTVYMYMKPPTTTLEK